MAKNAMHHFHQGHNAPCLPPSPPITIVFDFSWDDCNTPEEKLSFLGEGGGGRGVNKVHYGFGDSPYCCSDETRNKLFENV